MIFFTGLLTLLAIAHAGGDHHIKGGIKTLAHQEKITQEDIPPPPFGIKTAASSYGTKIGAGDGVKGTRGAPRVVQQLADDSLQPSDPSSIKTLSTTDAQTKTAPRIDPASALHHAVKTLSQRPGKIEPSPGLHHSASVPVVQDQVHIADPASTKGIKTLKTAPGRKTTFISQDTQVRDPTAHPVIQTVKTIDDPNSRSVKRIKTMKAVAPAGKTHFTSQDTQVRDPVAHSVTKSIKTVKDPSKPADSISNFQTVKTLQRNADTFSRSKTVKSATKTLQQTIDSRSASSIPASIVEASRRTSNPAVASFSAGTYEAQRRPSSTQDRQQAMLLANTGSQTQTNLGNSVRTGAITLNEEILKLLQDAGGIVNENGEMTLNEEGMNILQKAGIRSSIESPVAPLRAPTVFATSVASRGQNPNAGRGAIMNMQRQSISGTRSQAQSDIRRTGPAGSSGLRTAGAVEMMGVPAAENESQRLGGIATTGITGQRNAGGRVGMRSPGATAHGAAGLKFAEGVLGATTGLQSAGAPASRTTGLPLTIGSSGEMERLRSAGVASRVTTGIRTAEMTTGITSVDGQTTGGETMKIEGATGSITLNEETLRAIQSVGGTVNANGEIILNDEAMRILQSTGGISSGQRATSFTSSGVSIATTGLRSAGAVSRATETRQAGAVPRGSAEQSLAGGGPRGIPGLRSPTATVARRTELRREGGVPRATTGQQSSGIRGNAGQRLEGGAPGAMRRTQPVATSGATGGLSSDRGTSGIVPGLRPAGGSVTGTVGLRTSGEVSGSRTELRSTGAASRGTARLTSAGGVPAAVPGSLPASGAPAVPGLRSGTAGLRSEGAASRATAGAATGEAAGLRPSGGATSSITLNEETLRAIQSVGGTVSPNGEIILNDEAMRVLQSTGGITSGQRATLSTSAGISRIATGVRSSAVVSRATTGPRPASSAGAAGLSLTGGIPGVRSGSLSGAAAGILSTGEFSRITTGSRSEGAPARGTTGWTSAGEVPVFRPTGAVPRRTTGGRSPGLRSAGGALRATSGLPSAVGDTEGTTGLRASGGATRSITLNQETLRAIQSVGGTVNANGEIILNDEAMKILQSTGGVASGQRATSLTSSGVSRATARLRSEAAVSAATTGIRPSSSAGAAGLALSGGVPGRRTIYRPGAVAGLRSAGQSSGITVGPRPAGVASSSTTGLTSSGGIPVLRPTGTFPRGTAGVRSTGGFPAAVAGSRQISGSPGVVPSLRVASGTPGPRSEGGALRATAGLPSAAAATEGTTGLRASGGSTRSITLNEETLRAIQSEGGTVNANGEITLNDEGMKILHSTGGIASGQQATPLISSGVSRATTGLRLVSAVSRATTGTRPASSAGAAGLSSTGGVPGTRRGSRPGAASGARAGLRSAGEISRITTRPRPAGAAARGTVRLSSAGGVPGAVPVLRPAGEAVIRTAGLSPAGAVSGFRTGLQSTGAAARGPTDGIPGANTASGPSIGSLEAIPGLRAASGTAGLRSAGGTSRATASSATGGVTRSITLNEETLRAIESVGGTVNPKGEITLNDEALRIIESSGGINFGQRATSFASGVSRTTTGLRSAGTVSRETGSRSAAATSGGVAGQSLADRGSGATMRNRPGSAAGAAVGLRSGGGVSRITAGQRPAAGSLQRQPAAGYASRLPISETSSMQQGGRFSPDIRTSISSATLSNQPITTSNADAVLFNGKEINIGGLQAGQIFDENLQPISTENAKVSADNQFRIPQSIQSESYSEPSLSGAVSSTSRSSTRNLAYVSSRTSQVSGLRGQAPNPSRSRLTANAPNAADKTLPSSSMASSGAATIIFNGKEIDVTGLRPGQIFDENLQPITSNSGDLRIPSPLLQASPGGTTTITGSPPSQSSSTSLSEAGLQALQRPSFTELLPGNPSSRISTQTGSRSRTDLLRARQTGSTRIPAPTIPQRSPFEISAVRSSGISPAVTVTSGSISSTTSGIASSLRRTTQLSGSTLRSTSAVPSRGSPIIGGQPVGITSPATGSRIPTRTVSSTGGIRIQSVSSQRSPTGALRSETAAIQPSTTSGIRTGLLQRQDSLMRSPRPSVSSSGIPYELANSPNSLASGTIVFNGREISINGLRAGQIFDENLQPISPGMSGTASASGVLPQTLSPETPRRGVLQSSSITPFRETGVADQTGTASSLRGSSDIQMLNEGGIISTYTSAGNTNTGSNPRRISQNKITQEIGQDRIQTRVIQQEQDPLSLFQEKVPQQQIVQEEMSLKVPSVHLSQKSLDPTGIKQTQMKIDDVLEQRSEAKPSDIRNVQEEVPAFTKVTEISQRDIDIPTTQQRVLDSEFLPRKSFLAPFNYGIPQIRYLKTGHQTPFTQEQQKLEQIFV